MSPERLPMFPLGSVVFPYSGVPLRVFEPRYLTLMERLEEADDASFGTVMIERGFEVGGGDVRAEVGTRVRVIARQDVGDGSLGIVVAGVERIRVNEWLEDDPHPWAVVEPAHDVPEPIDDLQPEVRSRVDRILALASELGADTRELELEVADDPVAASYQYAAMVPVTPLDSYRLLAADGPRARMEMAVRMLDEQTEIIRARLGEA